MTNLQLFTPHAVPGWPDLADIPEHGKMPVNPTAPTGRVDAFSDVDRRILQRLKYGPVTPRELIAHFALNYRARISEVRAYVRQHGWDVVCNVKPGGSSTYRLVEWGRG